VWRHFGESLLKQPSQIFTIRRRASKERPNQIIDDHNLKVSYRSLPWQKWTKTGGPSEEPCRDWRSLQGSLEPVKGLGDEPCQPQQTNGSAGHPVPHDTLQNRQFESGEAARVLGCLTTHCSTRLCRVKFRAYTT